MILLIELKQINNNDIADDHYFKRYTRRILSTTRYKVIVYQ